MLVKAAVEGKLATRADATKHQGDYRKIVEGRQPDPGRRDRAVERVRRVRGPHLEGRYPAQDHRQLQRRLQRNQEQPEHLHRRCQPVGGRWRRTDTGDAGRQTGGARRRGQASGRLPQVDRRLQPDAGQRHQAVKRVRRVRGPDLEGRHSAEDHRHLPRRLQRDQEQPEQLHRQHQRAGHRRRPAGEGGGGRQTGHPRRRHQAPGRLPQDRRRRQQHARRGDRAAERVRRVRGPHLEGRHPAEDHRHLQRRLQRDQEQPEQLHRQHQRAGHRRRPAGEGGGGRQTGHPRRRHQAPGRLPQDRRRRQPDPGRSDRAVERVRRVRGPHLEGRHPAEDHRHLQRRLQRDQEQPEQLHRQHQRAGGRRRPAGEGGGGRQTGHPRRRHQAPGRLPQDRRRRQPARSTR